MCTAVNAHGNELLCGNCSLSLGDTLLTSISKPIVYEYVDPFLLIKLLNETGISILFVVFELLQVERIMVAKCR